MSQLLRAKSRFSLIFIVVELTAVFAPHTSFHSSCVSYLPLAF